MRPQRKRPGARGVRRAEQNGKFSPTDEIVATAELIALVGDDPAISPKRKAAAIETLERKLAALREAP